MGQELLTIPEHLNTPSELREIPVVQSLVFCAVCSRSLFVIMSFFVLPLHCPSFFDLRLLIIPLVSSNLSLISGNLYELTIRLVLSIGQESAFPKNKIVYWTMSININITTRFIFQYHQNFTCPTLYWCHESKNENRMRKFCPSFNIAA